MCDDGLTTKERDAVREAAREGCEMVSELVEKFILYTEHRNDDVSYEDYKLPELTFEQCEKLGKALFDVKAWCGVAM